MAWWRERYILPVASVLGLGSVGAVADPAPVLVGLAAAVADAFAPVPSLAEVAITSGLVLDVAGAGGLGLEVAGPAFRCSLSSSLRSSMDSAWREA